jgi:hypothetical protein
MKYQITILLPLLLVALALANQSAEASSSKHCNVKSSHKSSHKSNRHHKHKASTSTKSSSASTSKASSSDYTTTNTTSSTKSASSLTPNGMKAGLAGGDSLNKMKGSISWMTTWTPEPYEGTDLGDVEFASMAWGIGQVNHDNDAARWAAFKKVPHGKYKYVIGFNEADFSGQGSSGLISTSDAANAWDTYIAPHGAAGSVLISPSCAKQQSETWMGPFLKAVKTQPDVINVHIFKNKASQISTDLDHFAKYGKPLWITEMACIDYSSGTQYCNQEETNTFINEAIKILEADDRVAAYAWSDAYNGPSEKLTTNGQSLSTTGSLLKKVMTTYAKRSMVEQKR